MTTRRWFVVQTRIQSEEKATKSLRAKGYRVYAPKMRKTIIHHRTKEPLNRRFRLFNRYLFVSLPEDFEPHIGAVRGCRGVYDMLGFTTDGKALPIGREIVRQFMLAQRRGEFDDVVPITKKQLAAKVPLGSKIRLRSEHVFGGFYGQVTRIKGKGVIRAGIEIFGRLVSVEVGPKDYDIAA